MNNKLLPEDLKNRIIVHIDDFLLGAETKMGAIEMKCKFDGLCDELNIEISHEKDEDIVQEAVVYGFKFNLKNKTVGIPDDKLSDLIKLIQLSLKIKVISGSALESLCGKIMHWSQLYKPAKALCYNMVAYLHKLLRAKQDYKRMCFKIPGCILQDLKFWLKYTELIKSVTMESILYPPSMTIVGTSDACDFGAGFCIDKHWAYYEFRYPQCTWHINQKEAHAVIMLLHNLKDILTGKKLVLMVDNTSLFYSMAKHWGSELMMPCIYEICYLMMEYKIQVWFEWIPTEANKLADSLSRFDFECFWKWVRLHGIRVNPFKTELVYHFNLKYRDLIFRHS